MKKKNIASVFFLVLSLLLVPALSGAETLKIAGDPCSVPLISALVDAYSKKTKDLKAEVSSFSCTLGVYKTADGEFDIGVSTQNGLSSNLPRGAVNHVLAKSPIVMIVNRNNPVDNISYAELQGIMSGRIKNWKDAGGPDLEIKNVMLAPCVKHTISKQVALYGDGLNLLTPEKRKNPVSDTNRLVADNDSAIGQQIYGYESAEVKVLRIDGILPEDGTVPSQYSLFQDFNVVTKGKPKGAVKKFIEFAESEEGKKLIREMKHLSAR